MEAHGFGEKVSRGDAEARRNAGGVGGTRRRIGLGKRSHAETLRRGGMRVGWVFHGADEFGEKVSRGDAEARRNAWWVGGRGADEFGARVSRGGAEAR